jgi:UDP-N-acetylmuramyl pentapeptide phosphotransferase/UDP-N-acetylglucosamine-1-phosphate transferase
MQYILFISLLIAFIILNLIFKKMKLFSSYSGEVHQTLTGKKTVPLSGGIFIFLFAFVAFFENYNLFSFYLFFIFLLGFLSDINVLSSPKIRFFIQVILLLCFVHISELHIPSTRIIFFDQLLEISLVSLLFTSFCMIVVINGTNFMDGLNGLVLGYYFSIILILFNLGLLETLVPNIESLIFLLFFLAFLFVLNILSQLYLGDSGAYLISLIACIGLIQVYIQNQYISPFFIVLLLWYPSFENLFSILRKFNFRLSPVLPDRYHLHQLIYIFIKKKTLYKKNANNLSSFIIIFYNFVIFFIASLNAQNSDYQIALILFNVIFYIFIYSKIFSFLRLNNKN